MSADKLCIAVPSKGRLQENTDAFFRRSGLEVTRARGARDYRGRIKGLDGVEIRFLSASEITGELAAGNVHLGVTGEDLIRETIPDADAAVELVTPLGFGHANVVAAVPQAWIDASTMADLNDIAQGFRARHGRRLRLATKYINLARAFFAEHGIVDYRIVESLGATEGAPAAGTADLIVDITTTGSTLSANALKVLDDGIMLRSEANLVASLKADWPEPVRAALRAILDRIAAEEAARRFREVRFSAADPAAATEAAAALGAAAIEGDPTVLHCPAEAVYELVAMLQGHGAETISVSRPDYIFSASNPLYERVMARL